MVRQTVNQKRKKLRSLDRPLTRSERSVVAVYGASAFAIIVLGASLKAIDDKLVLLLTYYGLTIIVSLYLWVNTLRK